jgi:flagellar biosynthetic protein FliO
MNPSDTLHTIAQQHSDSLTAFTAGGLDSIWPSIGQLAGALVLVLVLIWGTMWFVRRLMKGSWTGRGDSRITVLERLHLAPKKSIEIVSVGNRILLLGVTEGQIGLLTELKPDDLKQDDAAAAAARTKMSAGDRRRELIGLARHKLNELFRAARASEADAAPTTQLTR